MQYQVKSSESVKFKADALVVGVYSDQVLSAGAQAVNQAGSKSLAKFIQQEKFRAEPGSTLVLHHSLGQSASRLVLLGLGKRQQQGYCSVHIKSIAHALGLLGKQYKHIAVDLNDIQFEGMDSSQAVKNLIVKLTTGLWQFTQFKSEKPTKPALQKLTLLTDKSSVKTFNSAIALGKAQALGINYARELGNLPGNVCTPSYLASEARAMVKGNPKASAKILSEKQMKELGMGAFLSVSVGSDEPGQMIVLEYRGGPKSQAPVALVGKGITFDTGGISLKPGAAMDEMKFDMCGAASVLGTFKAVLEQAPKLNLIVVVAAAENMPSGRATKPGDIVTTMSGLTVEILNTDAEGRLVLCDALTYVQRYKPKAIVDVATLTGACVIALGSHAHGLYSNDQTLADELLKAGVQADDRAWQMPLWDEYQKQLDSNFADMANIGGREAGSVTAACYLSRFVKNSKWAHLDIAGTAWKSGGAKGATGRPVSLLLEYLAQQ